MRSEEHIIGEAEVLKVFKLTGSRKNVAAGCRVKEGFLDNSNADHVWKVIRDHQPVHEGKVWACLSLSRSEMHFGTTELYKPWGKSLKICLMSNGATSEISDKSKSSALGAGYLFLKNSDQ